MYMRVCFACILFFFVQAAGYGILCDKVTYEAAASHDMHFETLAPIRVKGMKDLVPIFKPIGRLSGAQLKSVKVRDLRGICWSFHGSLS